MIKGFESIMENILRYQQGLLLQIVAKMFEIMDKRKLKTEFNVLKNIMNLQLKMPNTLYSMIF